MAEPVGHSRARASLGAVCERIRNRTPVNRACALEGVPRSSFYALLDADEEARLLVEQARALAEEQDEAELRLLIRQDRKAANAMLKVMSTLYPDTWRETSRVEQTGRDGGPIEQSVTIARDEALALARKKGE